MLEEVLDLLAGVLGHVVEVLDVRPARVLRLHADHLGVDAGVIRHVEDGDRANRDGHAGERRVVEQHERVDGVAVEAEGVLEEAVVGRVDEAREEHPVEAHATRLVIDLVLVARTLRDLDDDVVRGHGNAP